MAVKAGLSEFPPVLFAALRDDVAGVVMLGYAVVRADRWAPVGRRQWATVGVVLGLGESLASVTWSPRALWALGYLSLGASAAGFLVYFTLLERLGPVEITLVSCVAPLFVAISGFLFLGEVVDVWAGVGFVCILAEFFLIKRRAVRRELPRLTGRRDSGRDQSP